MSLSDAKWIEGARTLEEDVLGEIYDVLSPELYRAMRIDWLAR